MSLELFGFVVMPGLTIAMALAGFAIFVRMTPRAGGHAEYLAASSLHVADKSRNDEMEVSRRTQSLGTRFRPLHDRVVVRRLAAPFATAGDLVIPDTAKEKSREGEIVAVGPGSRDESGKRTPLGVKAGDKVLFDEWSGAELEIEGEDLVILKESDITGIIAG